MFKASLASSVQRSFNVIRCIPEMPSFLIFAPVHLNTEMMIPIVFSAALALKISQRCHEPVFTTLPAFA